MSISRKVFKGVTSLKNIVERRSFKTIFTAISAFVLFVGVFNVYAQEESLNIEPDWEGTKEFHNVISGTEGDEDNMNSRQGLEVLNGAWTALSLVAPELTANADEVQANANIPADLKGGLLGLTDDAAVTVYANFPLVNVPDHLAQEWVPGYKDSVTSTYAANSSVGHPSGYIELVNTGIVSLWNRVLNLSYVFFVIVMLAAGFMIMFRHKLGGQTMVTLGNVLPGVVLALVLATFSFAIAGLIIDMGGILTGLVAYILGGEYEVQSISSLGGLFKSVFTGDVTAVTAISGLGGIGMFLGAAGVAGGFAALASSGVGLIAIGVVGVLGIVVALIIVGVVFVGAVKVLIVLYKAYFSLLLNVILAPVNITLGAFPGNRHMINNWFLSVLRNVLVFPVVLFIVNIPSALVALGAEATLNFPGKLVYEDPETYNPSGAVNAAGGLFIFILRIFVLYFAAQAPKFLEAWLPANSSKAVQEGIGAAKGSLSKIPLIGGLLK